MKTLVIFAILALAAADDDLYDLEKMDIAGLASNMGEFKKLIDCFVNKGPCTELYQSYKVLAPESIKEVCRRCTVEQKQTGNKFFETIKTNFPEDYVLFKQIYDPENKYMEALELELTKYKTISSD